MTAVVNAMSSLHSTTETKPTSQYGEGLVSGLGQSQPTANFFPPCQPPGFNPFMYLSSYASPSTPNCYSPTTNPQQTFPSSTSQNSLVKPTHPSTTSSASSAGSFVCGLCGKEFGMRCRLLAHVRRHTGERPFSCVDCGRGFSDAGNLQRHRYTHSSEPRFRCTVCGKTFRQASCLSNHRRFHCAGADGRCCVFCRRNFKSSSSLQMHLRFKHRADAAAVVAAAVTSAVSTGRSPPLTEKQDKDLLTDESRLLASCSDAQCAGSCCSPISVAFRRANSDSGTRPPDRWRKSHQRKPPACCEAGQGKEEEVGDLLGLDRVAAEQLKLAVVAVGSSAAAASTLDAKGRPCNFLCPACPRRFAFQCRLAAHLRSHTNFRPFTCPDCGRAFTQRGYLVRHAAVHANERPFACTLCDRAYKHYGSLVNHRRTHTKTPDAESTSKSKQVATTNSFGHRYAPTMAPAGAPPLSAWASVAAQSLGGGATAAVAFPFPATACPPTSHQQQQHHHQQSFFFRSPFGHLPTPQ
uniref:C2H2-type domain-containing protein n=1 Tax=Mesocestoides corti TaxID=53468 RepID=A0A5K3FQ77_MESCO